MPKHWKRSTGWRGWKEFFPRWKAHAVAWVTKEAGRWKKDDLVLINLSGRGDKDVAHVAAITGADV